MATEIKCNSKGLHSFLLDSLSLSLSLSPSLSLSLHSMKPQGTSMMHSYPESTMLEKPRGKTTGSQMSQELKLFQHPSI